MDGRSLLDESPTREPVILNSPSASLAVSRDAVRIEPTIHPAVEAVFPDVRGQRRLVSFLLGPLRRLSPIVLGTLTAFCP